MAEKKYKIFTSYFGAVKHGKIPSSQCVMIPLDAHLKYLLPTVKELTPSLELSSWWGNLSKYKQRKMKYQVIYENVYQKEISDKIKPYDLLSILDGKILICSAKPGTFSHRSIVANWLQENCPNVEVKEISTYKEYLKEMTK